MAPQPIAVPNILSFGWTIDGQVHHQHLYVHASPSGDSTGYDLLNQVSGSTPLSDAITRWAAKVGPVLGTGTTSNGVTLYSYSGGALIPLYTASYALTPGSAAYASCSQATMCFRDSVNKLYKFTIMEGQSTAPYRITSPTGGSTEVNALIADLLSNTSPAIGAWNRTRGAGYPDRFISYVVCLNRKIRRRRNVA